MRAALSFALASFAALCASATTPEDACAAALRRALGSSASWTMERRLEGSVRPLVSSGTVECFANSGIVWRVERPFPSSVEMTADRMVFEDEDGRRVKTLGDMPHYGAIRERTDAFANGEAKAFEGLFKLEARSAADGEGWVLVMTPEISAMRHLFAGVELSGGQALTNVVLKTGDGGVSTIRFREIPCAR